MSKDVSQNKHILIGQTKSGRILTNEECKKNLNLPVIEIEERDSMDKIRLGNLLTDFEGIENLDNRIS